MFCDKCGNKMEVKKNKLVPILIGVIAFLVIIIGVLAVLLIVNKPKDNCNCENAGQAANNTNEVTTEETTTASNGTKKDTVAVELDFNNVTAKPEDTNARSSKLEFKNAFYSHDKNSKYGYANLLFMNNNDEMVDTTIYINFYKDGKRIGSESGGAYNIKPNHLFVDDIMVDFNEEYDSFDITYGATKSKSTYDNLTIDSSKINTVDTGDNIIATYDAAYDKESSYWAYILYKKDGKVVFCENAVNSSTNTSDIVSFKFFKNKVKDINYDSYEISIYSASKRVEY